MVDHDIIARKIAGASARLADLERLTSLSRSDFIDHREARDLAAFYFLQAVQECVDLASHWVADAGLQPGDDAGSVFDALADEELISSRLATVLRGAVGLRNLIAHGYAAIDHGRLHDEILAGLGDLRRFLRHIAGASEPA
ncbi:MAG: HepT-like ribonuclease domain-containing protein [Acidobacteriota bacterium]